MLNKEAIRREYQWLKANLCDLCHVETEVARSWVKRAKKLREMGAWYHYMILIRKARDYLRKNKRYLERFEQLLKNADEPIH